MFCWECLPALYIELGEVLLQVFLDEDVRSLLGLTEASHDQRQSFAQRAALRSCEARDRGLLSNGRERNGSELQRGEKGKRYKK